MRKVLKSLLVIFIFALVGLIAYTASYYINNNKGDETTNSVISNNNVQSNTTNSIQNNTIEEPENEIEENVVENNKVEEKEEVNSLSDEEKAIQLAKEQYGSTENVYFRVEQIESNNIYIVSVRDAQTTRDIIWYSVNVSNGTVKQN